MVVQALGGVSADRGGQRCVVASLPDIDPTAPGAYRVAITELGEGRAVELLHDLRNAGRNPRRYRNADGKPRYRGSATTSRRFQQG